MRGPREKSRMKKVLLASLFILAIGCYSAEVKKEQEFKADWSRYKVIHVGWIDYPAGNCRKFLYNNTAEWQREINHLNYEYLMSYFKKQMSNKKFIGPTKTKAIPRGGDVFIKFDFLSYENKFNYGFTGVDYLNIRVEMFDSRKGRKIYSGLLRIPSNEPGPGDWSVYGINGRLEMEIRNLVKFISSKF
jgi:hypothetical protein